MEGLSALRSLLVFERTNSGMVPELLEFVMRETLKNYSPISIFVGVLRSSGAVYVPFGLGHNAQIIMDAPEHFLDVHTPGYDAYVNGQIVETGNIHEYPFYLPENIPAVFPNGFEASWIFPIPNYGALYIFCAQPKKDRTSHEDFLHCVGEIFSQALLNGERANILDLHREAPSAETLLPLTPRQWAIKDAMLRGLTNGAIAREMNFSESLIRHETIRIYSKLGINGRKELFALEAAKANNAQKMEA